jgi:hypothetical protein
MIPRFVLRETRRSVLLRWIRSWFVAVGPPVAAGTFYCYWIVPLTGGEK